LAKVTGIHVSTRITRAIDDDGRRTTDATARRDARGDDDVTRARDAADADAHRGDRGDQTRCAMRTARGAMRDGVTRG
jgi:hypothetical protein